MAAQKYLDAGSWLNRSMAFTVLAFGLLTAIVSAAERGLNSPGGSMDTFRKYIEMPQNAGHVLPRHRRSTSNITIARALPVCDAPSNAVPSHWTPNGKHRFSFFFGHIPIVRQGQKISRESAILYLRIKQNIPRANYGGKRRHHAKNGEHPKIQLYLSITEPTCAYTKEDRLSECSMFVPVESPVDARTIEIDLTKFLMRWIRSGRDEPRWLELSAFNGHNGKDIDIGDYFVGMRCGDESEHSRDQRLALVDSTAPNGGYPDFLGDSLLRYMYVTEDHPETST